MRAPMKHVWRVGVVLVVLKDEHHAICAISCAISRVCHLMCVLDDEDQDHEEDQEQVQEG